MIKLSRLYTRSCQNVHRKKQHYVCLCKWILPGREWGDELPLLGPADGGRWDTVDLTWQNGILTLNRCHLHWLCWDSGTSNSGPGTHWTNIHRQTNTETVIQVFRQSIMYVKISDNKRYKDTDGPLMTERKRSIFKKPRVKKNVKPIQNIVGFQSVNSL